MSKKIHISSNPDTMRLELGEAHMQRGGNPLDQYYAPKARPSTGLRRGRSDVDFDVAVPRGLARGFVAGAAGAPGDIEMISRLLANTPGVAAYGQATGAATPGKYREGEVGMKTRLPTSEEIEERLPFRGTSPLERAATGLGMIGGGFYSGPGAPIRAVTAIPSAIGRAGRDFVMAAGQPAVNVIKPKGGNWLDDRLKRELQYLKSPERASGRTPEQEIERYRELLKDPSLTPVNRADVERYLEDEIKESAVDQWVGRNLTNYIKNQMATPEDPVRLMLDKRTAEIETKFAKDLQRAEKLAERAAAEVDPRRKTNLTREAEQAKRAAQGERDLAMSHILPTQELTLNAARVAEREAKINRAAEGFPLEGMAKSPAAKAWEDITDSDMGVSANRAVDAQSAIEKKRKAEEALEVFKAKDLEINEAFIKMAAEKGMSPAQIDAINRAFPTRHKLDLLNNSDLTAEYERLSKAAEVQRQTYKDKDLKIAENYPWVERLAPESRLYEFYGSHDLGFDHIIDVLKQDLAAGRITADQLSRMSVDQVIKRAADYDKELAASMNASRAVAREGLPVYKEYPEGYRWVELNRPGAFSSESEAMGHSVRGYEPPKGHPDWVESAGNSGILSYGHGGWEGIKSGRAKVYSLVDPSGNPHVTVEVASNRMRGMSPSQFYQSKDVPKSLLNKIDEAEKAGDLNDIGSLDLLVEYSPEYKAYRESLPSVQNITQIKGKQNAAPNEEYLPFVQDFVRSGQWSEVRDLKNTGFDYPAVGNSGIFNVDQAQKLKQAGFDVPNYITRDEANTLKDTLYRLETGKDPVTGLPVEGKKRGGPVHISSNPDTMRLELNERRLGAGGFLAKAVKGAQKALPAAEREANLQKFLEPSKTPMRLYHGTTATEDIHRTEAIRRLKPSKEGALGSGVYLTPKTNFSNEYADPYIPGSTDFASGNVLPVHAQIKNPLIINGSASNDPMIEALIRLGMDESKATRMVERAYENKGYIGKEVETRARAQGYDGLMQYDRDGELTEVVSYNPNAIKSAIGNEGTYDINVPDLSKAEGGAISADDLTIEERPL